MLKTSFYRHLLLATFLTASWTGIAQAKPTTTALTVVVNGIAHSQGNICLRVFSGEQGFPLESTSEVQSKCVPIQGHSSITQVFPGLKPGTYAVAVVDDQAGDHKLHRSVFGKPLDGFGLSRNPTVSILTGIPEFKNASFKMTKDTTIKISMKYSLD